MTINAMVAAPGVLPTRAQLPTDADAQLVELCRLMSCRAVDTVPLQDDLLMFVDDEGYGEAVPVNRLASMMAEHVTGADIHGTVIFTGPADERGDITSLPQEWLQFLTEDVARADVVEPVPEPDFQHTVIEDSAGRLRCDCGWMSPYTGAEGRADAIGHTSWGNRRR
jgi:hypothetical protein